MHAIRILRHHGLSTESLQMIFKVVVVVKLAYASPAWWGFTTADDRNRMEGFHEARQAGVPSSTTDLRCHRQSKTLTIDFLVI